MGAVLLTAGTAGKRFSLPNARIMIHQPLGGTQGQASDIEIHAKEILYLRGRLNEMLAKHTGQSVERISRDTDRDNFLSAEEAVKYGLVDKVLMSRNDANVLPPDLPRNCDWTPGVAASAPCPATPRKTSSNDP